MPREMVETGDWVVPTLNYLPYVEKPPLFYWLAATSYQLFGVSEAAARFPLAVLAALGLYLVFWMGAFLFETRTAVFGAVVLSSACLYFGMAHYITLDMGLAVMLLGVTAMTMRCVLRPKDSRWAAPGAWVFAALAFLAKGLVALVLPGVWVVALAVLVPAWRRPLLALANPIGIALFILIAGPWFWLVEQRQPGFWRFLFVEQHFERYLTPKYNRHNPWYFFLLVAPAAMLPWTAPMLAAVGKSAKEWRSQPIELALGAWVVIVVGFFSASSSKLISYILPVMPHLALLTAKAIQRPTPLWSRRLAIVLGATLTTAGLCAPLAKIVPPEALPWAAIGVTAMGLGIMGAASEKLSHRMIAMALGGLIAGTSALATLSGSAVELMSAKSVAQAIAARAQPGDAVWSYGTYLHGLPFYLRRRVDRMILWIGELHYAHRNPAYFDRFGDDDEVRLLPLAGRRSFVLMRAFEARHFISLTPPGAILDHGTFGRWEMAHFASAEEAPPPRERRSGGARRRRRQ